MACPCQQVEGDNSICALISPIFNGNASTTTPA